MKSLAYLLALIVGSSGAYAAASDSNLLGFYVGGSVGQSDVRTSIGSYPPYSFDKTDTGWKALVGIRPIPLTAAELAYIDFGHPTSSTNLGPAATLHANALQRAPTLSGLIFAPIPVPVLDLYARAGVARLQSSGNGNIQCNLGYPCPLYVQYLGFDRTTTDFLYGAGVQLKFSALAIRLEYERIDDARGDPELLSVGLIWKF